MARKNRIGGLLRRIIMVTLLAGLWYLVRKNETDEEEIPHLTIDDLPAESVSQRFRS